LYFILELKHPCPFLDYFFRTKKLLLIKYGSSSLVPYLCLKYFLLLFQFIHLLFVLFSYFFDLFISLIISFFTNIDFFLRFLNKVITLLEIVKYIHLYFKIFIIDFYLMCFLLFLFLFLFLDFLFFLFLLLK
jgi:hypothetical protein